MVAATVKVMGRTPKDELPDCTTHGRQGVTISKDGTYGKRARQRFRCTDDENGAFHRFTPPLPKNTVALGICDTCENHVQTHQGPAGLPRGLYELREVVSALQAVAVGTTYTEAAKTVRTEYWGAQGTGRLGVGTVEGGQTVADWLERYGPAIIAHYPLPTQVETIVLDSTWYRKMNTWTGVTDDLFCVLGAYGYTSGGDGQVLGFWPNATRNQRDWEKFLRTLPKPRSVVADGERAIINAVKKVWPGVPFHRCEHHLYATVRKLRPAKSNPARATLGKALGDAFQSRKGWTAFKRAVTRSGHQPLVAWVAANDAMVTAQLVQRPNIPPHYGNSSIEQKLGLVRERIDSRAWTFRNRHRLSLLLSVMRLQMNRQYNSAHWLRVLTEFELTQPQTGWVRHTDTLGVSSLR